MRRPILVITIMICAAGLADAQDHACIGIFADTDYTYCYEDVEPFVYATVYLAALLPPPIGSVTAAEFRIDNLPSPADALVVWTWTTDLVIGDPGWDISLAWSSPQPGPYVLLGQGDFFYLFDPGDDVVLTVMEGHDCGCLVIVDGDFNTIDAIGLQFTFNCSYPEECFCGWCWGSPVEEASWGSIKALY